MGSLSCDPMNHWHSEQDAQSCKVFYTEDDAHRSAAPVTLWGVESRSGKLCDLPFPLLPGDHSRCGNSEPDVQTVQTVHRFAKGRDAPEVPKDNFFVLAETTIEASDATADSLGNRIIDILTAEHAMHIIKTSMNKFAIKAESSNPAWFILKVRIYSRELSHLVEFQRCNGDVVAFYQCFHKVMVLLNGKYNPMYEKCDFTPYQLVQDTTSMQPLIEMANNNSDPHLLAEAASALANSAVKPQKALELCVPEAFTAFEIMLRAGGYNVLSPLVELLSLLAMTMKARPLFAAADFWEALLDVMFAEETCMELRTQYAHVVRSALASGTSKGQMWMLKAATNSNLKGVSEQVRQMLEEVAHMANR